MAKPGLDFSAILKEWQSRNKYSPDTAAAVLGTRPATYKGWRGDRPVGRQNIKRVLEGIGVSSYEGAVRRYAPIATLAQAHNDYSTQSEDIILAYMDSTTELRETFLMRPSYRRRDLEYRSKLERFAHKRILTGKMKVYRVEHFMNIQRFVDVLWNLRQFDPLSYVVRVAPYGNSWVPTINFTLFDSRAAITGGFHRDAPIDEPFMDFMGAPYIAFFQRAWKWHWDHSSMEFSLLENPEEFKSQAVQYARNITGEETITWYELDKRIEERGRLSDEYPVRF